MKKILIIFTLAGCLSACDSSRNGKIDNDPMSGYIKGQDKYTAAVARFMEAYTSNDFSQAEGIFADDAVFAVNDTKMTVSDMMTGFSVGHQFFDNITHSNVDMATMYYNDNNIFTNVWYDWSGELKSTGETLNLRGYGWFQWEDGKVIEAYNAFDPSAYNAAILSQSDAMVASKESIIAAAKAYQEAYIANNYAGTSVFLSNVFTTTIFNSSGQPLVIQNRAEIENSGAGWQFGTFEMSNFEATIAPNKTTAVVTFDAEGTIDFDEGAKGVPYSTRASQTWVVVDNQWKIMHSHWSPKTDAKGVPQE